MAEASSEWTAPEFERPEAYCTRFPESCNDANRLRVDPETRFLVDSFGRTTLLHGVNAIYKVDPYIPSEGAFDPQNSLNDEDIALGGPVTLLNAEANKFCDLLNELMIWLTLSDKDS